MFYQKEIDEALRFGDVLRGYISVTPNIEEPVLDRFKEKHKVNIDLYLPSFAVVISPCCSIGDKVISLTPLIQLRPAFFDNPYFSQDLTRINRKMKPQQAVAPEVWDRFPDEEKRKRLEAGDTYALLELFVYEENDSFPQYTLHRRQGDIKTNYYMIDFRNIYKLNCKKIVTPQNSPLESKYLQLSIQTRSELRDKIAFYYARVPEEDKILQD